MQACTGAGCVYVTGLGISLISYIIKAKATYVWMPVEGNGMVVARNVDS